MAVARAAAAEMAASCAGGAAGSGGVDGGEGVDVVSGAPHGAAAWWQVACTVCGWRVHAHRLADGER